MKTTSGTVINVDVAVISPHMIPFADIKPVASMGRVKAFLDVSTSAMINSFHENMKAKIAVAAMAGAESGNTIRNRTPN